LKTCDVSILIDRGVITSFLKFRIKLIISQFQAILLSHTKKIAITPPPFFRPISLTTVKLEDYLTWWSWAGFFANLTHGLKRLGKSKKKWTYDPRHYSYTGLLSLQLHHLSYYCGVSRLFWHKGPRDSFLHFDEMTKAEKKGAYDPCL